MTFIVKQQTIVKMKCNLNISCLLALVMAITACKKSYTGDIEDASASRSFTPANLRVSTVRDSAKFSWNAPLYITKADKYTLELSTDSMFSRIDYTATADTTLALIMDTDIKLNVPYYTRVRVAENTEAAKGASNYVSSTRPFRLVGQQYFKVLRDFELTNTTALLHWYVNAETQSVTQLAVITGEGTDTVKVNVNASEVSAGEKLLTALLPKTKYTVQLLGGKKSKGLISFTTPDQVTYTTTLSPTDNLASAIANALDGDVIGLNPGTYNLAGITTIARKRISIRSVSNNPLDTKILSREINLIGDSAGILLSGIEFSGNYTGTTYGVHFMQLQGQSATNAAAAFRSIFIDNCIIHDYTRAIIRANYGASANTHSINAITINNSQIYNIDQANSQGYYMFSFEKLQLRSLSINKSTLYNVGQGLINMSTNLSTTTGIVPVITLDHCTFNNFSGGSGKYAFIDANANKIIYTFSNSIVANTPISGSIQASAFRAGNTGNELYFSNNNYYKLLIAPGGSALNLTGLAIANPLNLDLGFTAATTNFSLTTLPQDHPVFSASTSGSTIGDPRWAY
jgi:hypothetical protein